MTEEQLTQNFDDCKNEPCTCEEKLEQAAQEEKLDETQEALNEIARLNDELSAQNERFLRLAAEYDNYRKRSEKDKISTYNDAKAKTIAELLPIADCLERAIESSQEADAEYLKGLEMLKEQFVSTLTKLGVEAFGEVGDSFDPEMHNAISHVENEALGENVIAQVFQRGYRFGEKIIRHAMVSVAN